MADFYRKKELPLFPHFPKPEEFSAQDWVNLRKGFSPLETGYASEAIDALIGQHTGPFGIKKQVPYLGLIKKYDWETPYSVDLPVAQQLGKHNASLILSPTGKHVGVVRATPEGVVKFWDPHGKPLQEGVFADYKMLYDHPILNIQDQEPRTDCLENQVDYGTCLTHSIDRYAHAFDTDKEHAAKNKWAVSNTSLPKSGIPIHEWLDLGMIKRATDLQEGAFEPDVEWTDERRNEYQDRRIGEGRRRKLRL